MSDHYDDLPNWTFRNDEVSFGQYRLIGRRSTGESGDLTGTDPEELTREALDYTKGIDLKRAARAHPKV